MGAFVMRPEKTLFYDVDTQRDFILLGGALAIVGTERIVPRLARLTTLAHRFNIRIIASADRHFAGDPELQSHGGQYPDHCMDGTAGQRKIDATAPRMPLWIENRELSEAEIACALSHSGELIFEKQLFDVFTGNCNARKILTRLLPRYEDLVIYGVYTEVCVADAIRGLLEFPPSLHLVTDATADLGAEGDSFRREWRAAGVEMLTVAELESRLAKHSSAKE
ncbi:MAG: cysteine hydrolase family protein [Candidatus Binataceae bacterium]